MSLVADFWQALERRNLPLTDGEAWQNPEGWWPKTAAGVRVSTEGALRYAAVYTAVRILMGTVGQLPLIVNERRADGGRDRALDFYLYDILHNRPNPLMTSFHFRTALQGHLVLWGNAYAEIEWSRGGQVLGLWPLRPDKVEAIRTNEAGDALLYDYRLPNGQLVTLPQRNVLHLRYMSPDGIVGYSPIALHRQGIGLALAAEEFGARFFSNDARPGMVLKHPGQLSDAAFGHLKESWETRHQGLSKSHRIGILEEGMELQEIGIPPQDAQYLEVRAFQRSEIYGMYGIPPHMTGDTEKSTSWGTGIEQQTIGYVVHTMGPWFSCWEQGLDQALMTAAERQRYYTKYVVKGLLRGDSAARATFYQGMFNIGVYSQNDIRELEDDNPIDGGDTYYVPLNMIPADQAARGILPSPEPEPSADEEGQRALPAPDTEQRARQAAAVRHRLQQAHMRIYQDAAGRLLRREANDVGNAARRLLGQRDLAQFEQWLAGFYEDFRGVVATNMRPVAQAYAELVLAEVLREVGGDAIAEARVIGYVEEYLQAQASRHATRHEERLRALLVDEAEGLLEQIEGELASWRAAEAAQALAFEESVRFGNAVAHFGYVALGVLLLRSVAIGKSCPFCRALNGRVISVTETFLQAGQPFQPEGAETPLTVTRSKKHPPYHGGCDCQVVAG